MQHNSGDQNRHTGIRTLAKVTGFHGTLVEILLSIDLFWSPELCCTHSLLETEKEK